MNFTSLKTSRRAKFSRDLASTIADLLIRQVCGFEKLLVHNVDSALLIQIKQYKSKVGSILYLAIHTRPDIVFACSALSRYLSNPSQQHVKGVDRIFRYIKGISNFGISYDGNSLRPHLHGYFDSEWGGDTCFIKKSIHYLIIVYRSRILCI